MKKLALVLILSLMMSAILSACGTKNEIADDSSTADTTYTPITTDVTDSTNITDTEDIADTTDVTNATDVTDTTASRNNISEEMAYDGVYNYCHSMYDWSIAEDNPDIMYLKMGEETESEYQVIFCSYTGAFVYFYVDKASGTTRLIEYVPNLNIEEEAGTINLYDYLESDEK